MAPQNHRTGSRFLPERILILALIVDVGWSGLSMTGAVSSPPPIWTLTCIFGAGCIIALSRGMSLSRRVVALERLLTADEADIAALSELSGTAHPDGPTITPNGPVSAGVRDALTAYRLAGYTDAEASALVREVLRIQVKDAGGWSP